jgi:hypothetical protein
MRHLGKLVLGFLLSSSTLSMGTSRLEDLADRLARAAEGLASESYRGFAERDRGNRADVEALYFVQQFSAGAALFRRMVSDGRPDAELRDAADVLSSQIRSSDRFSFGRRSWQEMEGILNDIGRELNSGASRRNDYDPGDRVVGRMHWQGTVDEVVQIFVQGGDASPRAVKGTAVRNVTFNLTAPLPRRPVKVEVRKLKGRGSVDVIQQPARDNDFTAVVEIRDTKGGAEQYEFELIW